MTPTLGAQIVAGRVALGWTQRQLADRLDTSQALVCRWERDAVLPSVERLPSLARVLRRELEVYVGGGRVLVPCDARGGR